MDDIKTFFSKSFPIIRDVSIFAAAIVTLVFNYFASSIREDIRTTQRDVYAIKEEFDAHKSSNAITDDKMGARFDELQKSLNKIDVRLSRIEGALGR